MVLKKKHYLLSLFSIIPILFLAWPTVQSTLLTNYYYSWGFEHNGCNTDTFYSTMGNGANPEYIKSIDGVISISPIPGSHTDNSIMRQVMMAWIYGGSGNSTGVARVSGGPTGMPNGVSLNPFGIIIKQMGINAENEPVHIVFNPPIYVQGGTIGAVVQPGAVNSTGYKTGLDKDCPDFEGNFVIQYQTNSP